MIEKKQIIPSTNKRVLFFNDVAFGETLGDYSFKREDEKQIKYKITHLNYEFCKIIFCFKEIELFDGVNISIEILHNEDDDE